MTRAAVYVRSSDEKQEGSPDRQMSLVLPYCGRCGYEVAERYLDEGVSGWKQDRPALARMIQDAKAGRFDVIVMDEQSRISRDEPLDFITRVFIPLRDAGVRVESVAGGVIRFDDLEGFITSAIRQHQSTQEVKTLSRRVITGMARKAAAGKWLGSPPFGYAVVPDPAVGRKLVLGDPLRVEAVRWLFAEYAAGRRGLGGIVNELARRGIVSPATGRPFSPNAVAKMLRNRAYLGDLVWNKVTEGKFTRLAAGGRTEAKAAGQVRRNPEADWIVVANAHEPLIDRETFQAVQGRLMTNRKRTTPHPDGGAFRLSKLLVCGKCGSWMIGYTDGKGVRRYRCGSYDRLGRAGCDANSVREDILVRVLGEKVQAAFLNPDVLAELRAEVRRQEVALDDPATRQGLERRLAALDRDIEQGEARLLVLPADVIAGAVTGVRKLKAEREQVRAELADLSARVRPTEELERVIEQVTQRLWRLREVLETGEPIDVREVFHSLITRVELHFHRWETANLVRTKIRGGTIYPVPMTGPVGDLLTQAGWRGPRRTPCTRGRGTA